MVDHNITKNPVPSYHLECVVGVHPHIQKTSGPGGTAGCPTTVRYLHSATCYTLGGG